MSVRASFWILFVLLFFILPLPMLGPFDPLVPAVRYVLLSGAAASVGVVEGAAGPVPLIILLFTAHAVFDVAFCAFLAWLGSKGLSGFAPSARRGAVLGVAFGAIAIALAFSFYRTPFGRAPTANLWGVLS